VEYFFYGLIKINVQDFEQLAERVCENFENTFPKGEFKEFLLVVVEDFSQCFIRLKSTLQRKNCMCDEYQGCISNLTVKISVLAGAQLEVLFTFFKELM